MSVLESFTVANKIYLVVVDYLILKKTKISSSSNIFLYGTVEGSLVLLEDK